MRVKPEEAERIKEAAGAVGESVAGYIVQATRSRMAGGGGPIDTESLKKAKAEAQLMGETLPEFLERAIKDTIDRDERSRLLPSFGKKEEPPKPKEEAKPAFNGNFYARHQEYVRKAKEEGNN